MKVGTADGYLPIRPGASAGNPRSALEHAPMLRSETPNPAWRTGLIITAIAGILCTSWAGCRRGDRSHDGKVVLDLWHVWGGEQADAIDEVISKFEASHPDIAINPVFTRNDLATSQKFFTAVAAGAPPDVIFVDGPQVAPWAEWGALEPLDPYLAEAGIQAEDYFDPCWRQCSYDGKTWALTYCADPNFGFVWNKQQFREAGLDPDDPPESIAELDAMAVELTTRTEDGALESIGFIPWAQYGPANSVFTWGWAFGGEFYDYETQTVTADDPDVVRSMAWMLEYADRFDVRKIAALEAGFGTQEQDPFYTGKMAMRCLHIGGIVDIGKYAPDLDWGVTFIPAPEVGGEERSSWVGGWCMSIPSGSPHPDEAFELIRWLCHDPEGTTAVGEASGLFPGVEDSPYFEQVRGEPYYGAFLQIIQETRHQRPVMPSQAFLMRELTRAVDAARFGKIPPPSTVAIVAPSGPDWAVDVEQGLPEIGARLVASPADAAVTIVDATSALPTEMPEGDLVLAVTTQPETPIGADGYALLPFDAGDLDRWYVAKTALREASENTQRELDLILKGSE